MEKKKAFARWLISDSIGELNKEKVFPVMFYFVRDNEIVERIDYLALAVGLNGNMVNKGIFNQIASNVKKLDSNCIFIVVIQNFATFANLSKCNLEEHREGVVMVVCESDGFSFRLEQTYEISDNYVINLTGEIKESEHSPISMAAWRKNDGDVDEAAA